MAGKMKFWIPDTGRMVATEAGLVPAKQGDPNWWRVSVKNGLANHTVKVDGRDIVIRGTYETDDPHEVRVLLLDGLLRCEPEDAVALGILPAAELEAAGKLGPVERKRLAEKTGKTDPASIPRAPEALHLEAHPKPRPLPDFDTMSRDKVLDWATSDDPAVAAARGEPIQVSSTWSRDRMLERIKKTLRERSGAVA
jgi:hypothetical protein